MKRKHVPGPIHERIRSLRKGLKMTQAQLAKKVGVVDKTSVSLWELRKLPPTDRLPALAEALGVTVAELIAGEKSFEALAAMFGAPKARAVAKAS